VKTLNYLALPLLFQVGECPFFSESLVGTYSNIMDHERTLKFPDEVGMSPSCVDLIRNLLTARDRRLGATDVDEIKSHPFFNKNNTHWTWENLRSCKFHGICPSNTVRHYLIKAVLP